MASTSSRMTTSPSPSATNVELDRLLLERRYAADRSIGLDSPHRPPGATNSPSMAALGASHFEPSLAASRQNTRELYAITQRMNSFDDRLDRIERSVQKALSKIEEQNDRHDADDRATEMLRISLRELEQKINMSETKTKAMTDRAAAEIKAFSQRLQDHEESLKLSEQDTRALRRALESVEANSATVRAQRENLYNEFQQLIRGTEDRVEQQLHRNLALSSDKIAQAVRLLQAHIKHSLHVSAEDINTRLEQVERDRHEVAQVLGGHGVTHNELSTRMDKLQAELANFNSELRREKLTVQQCDEEVKTLNRRLASALRHLSVERGSAYHTATAANFVNASSPSSASAAVNTSASIGFDPPSESGFGTTAAPTVGTPTTLTAAGAAVVSPPRASSSELDNFLVELDHISRPQE